MSDVDGMLLVDKAAGPTSHDVVALVRKRLRTKAGHTGTLDPQATGVLVVCLGRATRLVRFLQHRGKLYECVVRLGWATDTYDAAGEAVSEPREPPELDRPAVRRVLDGFVGRIEQVPPAYSAKKIRGEPAYRRARRGETVEPDPVTVEIDAIELIGVEAERLRLRVECGAGTYVRTLAHDLGMKLGCPSHLEALRRLRVGPFGIAEAVAWDLLADAAAADELRARVLPPAEMLRDWPSVVVNDTGRQTLANGGVVEPHCVIERSGGVRSVSWTGDRDASWVRILAEGGDLLAAAELLPGGMLQPRVVLA